jgi:predicted  nucleic acid-binding Zn-ribbon protein
LVRELTEKLQAAEQKLAAANLDRGSKQREIVKLQNAVEDSKVRESELQNKLLALQEQVVNLEFEKEVMANKLAEVGEW